MSSPAVLNQTKEKLHMKDVFEQLGWPESHSCDGVLYTCDRRHEITLCRYPAEKPGESFTVPDGVDIIGEGAFKNCTNLRLLNIPESVGFIEEYAFAYVSDLTIRFLGDHKGMYFTHVYPSLDAFCNGFYDREDSDVHLIVPRCSTIHAWAEGFGLDYRCDDDLIICDTEQLQDGRFKCAVEKYTGRDRNVVIPRNAGIKYFTIPCKQLFPIEDVPDYIVKNAIIDYFDELDDIEYILPRVAAQICDHAFENCGTITSVTLPDSMEIIGSRAFAGCAALQRMVVPASVTQIAPDAFEGCPDVILEVAEGSYAHSYALEHGIGFVTDQNS